MNNDINDQYILRVLSSKEKIIYTNLLKVLEFKQIDISNKILIDYIRNNSLTNIYITTEILDEIIKSCLRIQNNTSVGQIKANNIEDHTTPVLTSIIDNERSPVPTRELREEYIYIKGVSGSAGMFTNSFILNKKFNNVESIELLHGYVNDSRSPSGITNTVGENQGIIESNTTVGGSIGCIPFIWVDIMEPSAPVYSHYANYSVQEIAKSCETVTIIKLGVSGGVTLAEGSYVIQENTNASGTVKTSVIDGDEIIITEYADIAEHPIDFNGTDKIFYTSTVTPTSIKYMRFDLANNITSNSTDVILKQVVSGATGKLQTKMTNENVMIIKDITGIFVDNEDIVYIPTIMTNGVSNVVFSVPTIKMISGDIISQGTTVSGVVRVSAIGSSLDVNVSNGVFNNTDKLIHTSYVTPRSISGVIFNLNKDIVINSGDVVSQGDASGIVYSSSTNSTLDVKVVSGIFNDSSGIQYTSTVSPTSIDNIHFNIPSGITVNDGDNVSQQSTNATATVKTSMVNDTVLEIDNIVGTFDATSEMTYSSTIEPISISAVTLQLFSDITCNIGDKIVQGPRSEEEQKTGFVSAYALGNIINSAYKSKLVNINVDDGIFTYNDEFTYYYSIVPTNFSGVTISLTNNIVVNSGDYVTQSDDFGTVNASGIVNLSSSGEKLSLNVSGVTFNTVNDIIYTSTVELSSSGITGTILELSNNIRVNNGDVVTQSDGSGTVQISNTEKILTLDVDEGYFNDSSVLTYTSNIDLTSSGITKTHISLSENIIVKGGDVISQGDASGTVHIDCSGNISTLIVDVDNGYFNKTDKIIYTSDVGISGISEAGTITELQLDNNIILISGDRVYQNSGSGTVNIDSSGIDLIVTMDSGSFDINNPLAYTSSISPSDILKLTFELDNNIRVNNGDVVSQEDGGVGIINNSSTGTEISINVSGGIFNDISGLTYTSTITPSKISGLTFDLDNEIIINIGDVVTQNEVIVGTAKINSSGSTLNINVSGGTFNNVSGITYTSTAYPDYIKDVSLQTQLGTTLSEGDVLIQTITGATGTVHTTIDNASTVRINVSGGVFDATNEINFISTVTPVSISSVIYTLPTSISVNKDDVISQINSNATGKITQTNNDNWIQCEVETGIFNPNDILTYTSTITPADISDMTILLANDIKVVSGDKVSQGNSSLGTVSTITNNELKINVTNGSFNSSDTMTYTSDVVPTAITDMTFDLTDAITVNATGMSGLKVGDSVEQASTGATGTVKTAMINGQSFDINVVSGTFNPNEDITYISEIMPTLIENTTLVLQENISISGGVIIYDSVNGISGTVTSDQSGTSLEIHVASGYFNGTNNFYYEGSVGPNSISGITWNLPSNIVLNKGDSVTQNNALGSAETNIDGNELSIDVTNGTFDATNTLTYIYTITPSGILSTTGGVEQTCTTFNASYEEKYGRKGVTFKNCVPYGSFFVELKHYNAIRTDNNDSLPDNMVYIVDKPGNYIKKFNNLISLDKLKINIRNIVGTTLWGSDNCSGSSSNEYNRSNLLRWEFVFKVKYYINVLENTFTLQN